MNRADRVRELQLDEIFIKLIFDYDLLEYQPEPQDPRDSIPAITRARILGEGSLELIINQTSYVLSHEYTFFGSNDLVGGFIELISRGRTLFALQTEHSHEDSEEYWNKPKSVDVFIEGPWVDDFRLVYQGAQERAARKDL